jgi:CheY-like chemotaxis protein
MTRINILIVEDEMVIALNLKMQLENLLYNVLDIMDSGEKTIKKLEDVKPDLILMDHTLKGELDGIQTTEIISQKYKIPILYITAQNDQSTLDKIKNSSAIGVLTKPLYIHELDKTIQTILNKCN